MIQLAIHRAIPPLAYEQAERIRNIMTESSPNSPPFNKPFNPHETHLQPVSPVHPAAAYVGGKRNLSKRLIELISRTPHRGYAEPFVGMGGIFFKRTSRPKTECINDWSMDVSNFFRILQRHYIAFMDMLRYQITSRAGFELLIATDPSTLTDLERAARFLYLQRLAFGGKVSGRHFGVDPSSPARFDITKLGPVLEAIHERLSPVVIERLPWRTFVTKYDREGMLFYCDPPYFGCENDYGKSDGGEPLFGSDQFAEMATLFHDLKGRFILSLNDTEEVRKIFAGFAISEVETTYTVSGGSRAKRVGELIIRN